MSKYTTELCSIIKSYKINYPNESIYSLLGMTDYKCPDDIIRKDLNNYIIEYFYYREIGCENVEKWVYYFRRELNTIMEYYSQLIESCTLDFNPLHNIDLMETYTHDVNSNSLTKAWNKSLNKNDGENVSVSKSSNTPNKSLSDYIVDKDFYANQVDNTKEKINSNNEVENNGENTGNNSTKENYTKITKGSSAGLSFSVAIKQWREIMINYKKMIVDDLEKCFLQLY